MSADEIVAILDEQENIIGRKARKDLTDDDCWRCACIWIENSQGQVLMQQRAWDKKINPGTWTCAVIGTVVGDDTYEETAHREAEEEIGLTGHVLTPTRRIRARTSFGWRWDQGYKTVCDWPIEKFKVQTEEVAQLAWLDKAEVIHAIKQGNPAYAQITPSWIELFDLA
jgi:isopentenyldiphosphate isomerase